MASTARSVKLNEDLRTKLAYEWKNIYRALVQADAERKGTIPVGTFNKIIHQHKVFLQREDLRRIEQIFNSRFNNSL